MNGQATCGSRSLDTASESGGSKSEDSSFAPTSGDGVPEAGRCGATTADSPPRERWVLRSNGNQPWTGRQRRLEWLLGVGAPKSPHRLRGARLSSRVSPGGRVRADPGLPASTPPAWGRVADSRPLATGIWKLGTHRPARRSLAPPLAPPLAGTSVTVCRSGAVFRAARTSPPWLGLHP